MPRFLLVVALGVIGTGAIGWASSAAAQQASSTPVELVDANHFPASTVAYAELSNPTDLIALIFDHPLRQRIESLPPYQMAIESPAYKRFLFGRAMVEGQLQMPWRQALETFLANGVSVALDASTRAGAVIVHGKDAESMKLFSEKFLEFAKLGPNADRIKGGEYREAVAYQIDNVRYAVYQDRLIITSDANLGKAIVDLLIDGGESLANNAQFQEASKTRQAGSAGWAYVDVQRIRDAKVAPQIFEKQINNPAAELLVGGVQSTLQNAAYATGSLSAQSESIALSLSVPFQADWIPEQREYFFGPQAAGRGPALPTTDHTLFAMSTYRDFSEMWLRAGDLFNVEINDELAKADANLSTLFAGRDFGEDILGSFHPEVGIVVTRQNFAYVLPKPAIELPAFAAVFRLKDPEPMTRELRRIFQSLVGFLNVVGAMNGRNQLELDMQKLGDNAELVTSSFVPEADGRDSTDAEILFNFSPSVGFAGERFVIASSKVLAEQLTLAKQPDPALIDDNTRATLHAGILREVLEDNREQLVAQNMLEDGNSRQDAEAIIDLVLQVVDYFQDASLRFGPQGDQLRAEFTLRVEP